MARYMRALTIGLSAALILSVAVGTAAARNFSISNQNFRITWSPLHLTAGEFENDCHVTLEGSFHSRTIAKVLGTLLGYVTRVFIQRCTLSTSTGLNLPWHIRYSGFIGALPNIQRIRVHLIDASFLISVLGIGCLYRSTAARPAVGDLIREAGGAVTSLEPDPTAPIPLAIQLAGFGCPREGTFERSGHITLLGTSTRISLSLI